MHLQLSWDDPVTYEPQQYRSPLPIVLGRELNQLPTELDGEPAYQVVLLSAGHEISRFHALIKVVDGQAFIEDRSTNGTVLNDRKLLRARHLLNSGDTLCIGTYVITVTLLYLEQSAPVSQTNSTVIFNPEAGIKAAAQVKRGHTRPSTIIFNPETDLLEEQASSQSRSRSTFPPVSLFSADRVSVSALHATGLPVEEATYVALGGGIGSFAWVDTIRICGVKPEQIAVLGLQKTPYGRYEALLRSCQIPRYKRIRSGSDSCPDNIWGWPGYALREAWQEFFSGQFATAFAHLWQVFAEPVFADTYTPIADNVFTAMDREASRIGWDRMVRYGSIRSLRKTEDGRYAIAYSATKPPGPPDYRFLLARYVHLCTGYPAIKLLDDLQAYRDKTGDAQSVVHGYEPHDHVYEQLERQGGTVIIRGFGIVGSQILDRLYKARMINPKITVVHLSRSSKPGHKYSFAQRFVEQNWEFQPFNWPKGTWGGDMRAMLEAADPLRRRELLEVWGGTTTASRREWRQTIKQGLKEGWYTIKFGHVEQVERTPEGRVIAAICSRGYQGLEKIEADFVIDCTGLVSDPRESPFLNDLITHYNLDLNPQKRLHIENDFEIKKMRNDRSRLYAAGIITLGGPYAPVDTFLGLQYAAHRSAQALARAKAPGTRNLEGIGSFWQWIKWASNQAP